MKPISDFIYFKTLTQPFISDEHLQAQVPIKDRDDAHDRRQPVRLVERPDPGDESRNRRQTSRRRRRRRHSQSSQRIDASRHERRSLW